MKQLQLILASLLISSFSVGLKATIVEIQTSQGSFQVNLFDQTTPETVANFLEYVNSGAYDGTLIHRSVPGFVVQGGGYAFDTAFPAVGLITNPAVINEPVYSNLRGTIAMAKLGGSPNSATSQWFINLENNASALDPQNGGFTVFGQVIGNGMVVVDAVASLPIYNFSGPLAELPLQNYTQTDYDSQVAVGNQHAVLVSSITVVDSNPDSAAGINPTENTLIDASTSSDDSSGSFPIAFLLLLLMTACLRRR